MEPLLLKLLFSLGGKAPEIVALIFLVKVQIFAYTSFADLDNYTIDHRKLKSSSGSLFHTSIQKEGHIIAHNEIDDDNFDDVELNEGDVVDFTDSNIIHGMYSCYFISAICVYEEAKHLLATPTCIHIVKL